MLDKIGDMLKQAGLIGQTWLDDMAARGEQVKLYRDYYAGNHRLKLTKEMSKMMQIDSRLDRYNDNYCEMVVDTLADRLIVDTIEVITAEQSDTAKDWVSDIIRRNRLDGLQIAVHEATLRDGETFVMVEYRDREQSEYIYLSHELAWDGESGILPVYSEDGEQLLAAVKVWKANDITRVNIYYPNSTMKFTLDETGLKPIGELEETEREGVAPGVPLIPFRNRGEGRSELVNVIPLQDSLNRTLSSMVMSAELTAFSILFARGFKPDAAITPGMVIHAMISGADGKQIVTETKDEAEAYAALMETYELTRIPSGDLEQLIKQAEFLIEQIATVSNTPIASLMGSSTTSGEALKQRDVRLVGKARRAQVHLGNSWEKVTELAWVQQALFGGIKPPEVDGFRSRWKTTEIRNEQDIIAWANLMHQWGYERESLRIASQSSINNYSEADIDRLLLEKQTDSANQLRALAGDLPAFNTF